MPLIRPASTAPRAHARQRASVALLLVGVAVSGSACGLLGGDDDVAGGPGAGQVTVVESWLVASPGPDTTAYGTLWNQTSQDVTVIAARSDAAGSVQMRDPQQAAVGGLVVPANGYLTLAPGSASLRLVGLVDPVDDGESVTVTVTLQDGVELQLTGLGVTLPGDAGQALVPAPVAPAPVAPAPVASAPVAPPPSG